MESCLSSALRSREFSARVEIAADFAAARADWLALEALGTASPYQSFRFCRDWSATLGRAAEPLIVIARDSRGGPLALLPLARRRFGPLKIAAFQGGRMANYQMGLFREPEAWSCESVRAWLREAARLARVDAFTFSHQPRAWRGAKNPLAALGGQDSPSFAYCTELGADENAWTLRHFSSTARKKRRAKARKLGALGHVAHRRLHDAAERRAALDAFLAQKRARTAALGLANEFDDPAHVAFLERLASDRDDGAALELHALAAGDRLVAVFGALEAHGRLAGLLFSHDIAEDVAPASPGKLLVAEIVRDSIARGLQELDFGVGEAPYKSECCETVEPLFDSAYPATLAGHLAAGVFLAARRAKRIVKQNPALFERALSVERLWLELRAR